MIDIVFVGNIAMCGVEEFSRHLQIPHRVRPYPCDLAEAEVIVSSVVPRRMIEQAPNLRLVHATGAGLDSIAFDALPPGVRVCNVFHHERAIAEYILMTILALDRNLLRQDRGLRQGLWEGSCVQGPPLASELAGKRAGIIGFGHIGQEVARMAGVFDLEVRGLRSRHTPADLNTLLAESDFVVIACPLTEQSRGMIGESQLAHMRPTASLINVARGEIVDEAALYESLRGRKIRSAAIDVWYQYPKDDSPRAPSRFPFGELDNVILTPHSSAWTERVVKLRFRDIARNVARLAAGEPLENAVM